MLPIRIFLPAFWFWLVAVAVRAHAAGLLDEPAPPPVQDVSSWLTTTVLGQATDDTLPRAALEQFAWLEKLGIPDVRGCPPVYFSWGMSSGGGPNAPQEIGDVGFLLKRFDDGSLQILVPDLIHLNQWADGSGPPLTQRFQSSPAYTHTNSRLDYRVQTWPEAADSAVANQSRIMADGQTTDHGYRGPVSRAGTLLWAWACWRNGMDKQAAQIYRALEKSFTPRLSHYSYAAPSTLQPNLDQAFGAALSDHIVWQFANPEISRPQLLEACTRVATYCHGLRVAEPVMLGQMIEEDAAHQARAAVPLESLPTDERVAELMFRLRDQTTPRTMFHQRLEDAAEPGSPARQLAALGAAAVPTLIAALDDPHPTRSCSESHSMHGYDPTVYHLVTVGDYAKDILDNIAGYSFGSSQSWGKEKIAIRQRIEAWWKVVQQKGERQTLVDAVAEAQDFSRNEDEWKLDHQVKTLCERYPDAALAPLAQAARQVTKPAAHTRLVSTISKLPGEAALTFLQDEARAGQVPGACLVAARWLWNYDHQDEAAATVIREWQHTCARDPLTVTKRRGWMMPGSDEQAMDPVENEIKFLVGCGRADTLAALEKALGGQDVSLRLGVVRILTPSSTRTEWNLSRQAFDFPPGTLDDTARFQADVERVLGLLLEDRASAEGTVTRIDSEEEDDDLPAGIGPAYLPRPPVTRGPRIGELAARALARRFPEKYHFDLAASLDAQERQRLACLDTWQKSHPPGTATP